MYSEQTSDPEDDFKYCVKTLFGQDSQQNVLWSMYFSIPNTSKYLKDNENHIPKNVFLCSGPDLNLDYDSCIHQVRIFNISCDSYAVNT